MNNHIIGKNWRLVQLVAFLLLTLFMSAASADNNVDNYLNGYQYDEIDRQVTQTITLLQQSLNEQSLTEQPLTVSRQYFITHNLAYAFYKNNDKHAAIDRLDECLKLAKQLDSYHLATSNLLKAKTYGILFRDSNSAITALEQALSTITSSKHANVLNLQFDLLSAMSQAYNQIGQLPQASNYIAQALSIAHMLASNENIIHALIITGRIAFQQDHFAQASEAYLSALALTDKNTPLKQIASIELRLAMVYESQNSYSQSLAHAKKAVALYAQLDDVRMQSKSLRVLANVHFVLGKDSNTALVHYLNALMLAKEVDDALAIGELQHLIGRTYLWEKDFTTAAQYIEIAEVNLEKLAIKSSHYLGLNYLEQAKLKQHAGDILAAETLLSSRLASAQFSSYPEIVSEFQRHLLAIYVEQQKYQPAYLLQQQMLEAMAAKTQRQQSEIDHLDHEVSNKALSNKLAQLQLINENLRTTANHDASIKLFSVIIALLFAVMLARLVGLLTVSRRDLQRHQQQSIDNWPFFLSRIVAHSQVFATENNTANNHRQHSGLLVCAAKNNTQSATIENQYLYHQALEQYFAQLGEYVTTDHAIRPAQTRHQQLWWHIVNEPLYNVTTQLIRTKNRALNLHFVWLAFDQIPQNISTNFLQVIEQLTFYALQQLQSTSVKKWLMCEIHLDKNALPMLSADHEQNKFNPAIAKAVQLGQIKFIQTEL